MGRKSKLTVAVAALACALVVIGSGPAGAARTRGVTAGGVTTCHVTGQLSFSPALQGLNTGASKATVDANLTRCGGATAGHLEGLVGTVSPGNCTSLAISHVAPALSGGSVVWAQRHLAPSRGISFPAGEAAIISAPRGTALQVSYAGGSVTTGSFANSAESSMTVTSNQNDAQLAGKCRSKNGLSVDNFRGTATL